MTDARLITPCWVVTPCHRPHLDLLRAAYATLPDWIPANRRVVVANGDNPPTAADLPGMTIVPGPDVLSVAGWWNTGIDYVTDHGGGHILFLDSDATTTPATVEAMVAAADRWGLTYVGVDRHGVLTEGGVWIRTQPVPYTDLRWRPSGYCFLVSPGWGIRPDPRYEHWYLDDDLEMQAMSAGGVGMVAGHVRHPDGLRWDVDTDTKRARDRDLFIAKWGRPAW